jgi:hypothetical protein
MVLMTSTSTISLHRTTEADDAILRTLAQLDSARPLDAPALLAIVDGRPVAAASLVDGRVVADPFVDSRDAVRLLRTRQAALTAQQARRLPRPPRLRVRAAI